MWVGVCGGEVCVGAEGLLPARSLKLTTDYRVYIQNVSDTKSEIHPNILRLCER